MIVILVDFKFVQKHWRIGSKFIQTCLKYKYDLDPQYCTYSVRSDETIVFEASVDVKGHGTAIRYTEPMSFIFERPSDPELE